jgi:hypothetical protein
MNEDERWCFGPLQAGGSVFRQSTCFQGLSCKACSRFECSAWAVNDHNWHQSRNVAPALPKVELDQIICAHDPDETCSRAAFLEISQAIQRVTRADLSLKSSDVDDRLWHHIAASLHPFLKRWQACGVFERISRRDNPPDAIKLQSPHRSQCHQSMTRMRWIERAAEEADGHSRCMKREAGERHEPQHSDVRGSRKARLTNGASGIVFDHINLLGER